MKQPGMPDETHGAGKDPRPAQKEKPFITTDVQAMELLTRREHLFVEYLSLLDEWEEIDRKIYNVTCEIEGINKAFKQAIAGSGLSEVVVASLRSAIEGDGDRSCERPPFPGSGPAEQDDAEDDDAQA